MGEHDLLAACSDYCGGCAQYNGLAVAAAELLRDLADLYGFRFRSQGAFEFGEYLKGLEWFIANATCPGCREGGGPPWCQVRPCCLEKELQVCFECDEFPCSKVEEVADPDTMDRYRRFQELGLEGWADEQRQRAAQGYEIHLQKVVPLKPERPDGSPGP